MARSSRHVLKCPFIGLAFALIALGSIAVCENIPSAMKNIDSDVDAEKRAARDYSFGLGKRSDPEDEHVEMMKIPRFFGIGYNAIPVMEPGQIALIGVKRSRPARFNFGLGKRSSADSAFSAEQVDLDESGFEADKRASARYQFGIGKRATFGSNNDFDEYIKRRYSFGLGRR